MEVLRMLGEIEQKGEDLTELFQDAELKKACKRWLTKRETTIQCLESKADKIDEVHRKANIASLLGSSTGVVGGAMTLVGAMAAPFTLGVSLGLSLTGVAVGVAGGVTEISAKVTDQCLQSSNQSDVQSALAKDRRATRKLTKTLRKLDDQSGEIKKLYTKLVEYRLIQDETKRWLESCEPNALQRSVKGIDTFVQAVTVKGTDTTRVSGAISAMYKFQRLYEKVSSHSQIDLLQSVPGAIGSTCVVAAGVTSSLAARKVAKGVTVTTGRVLAEFGGALAGVGIAMDVLNIAVVAIDVDKGSKTKAARKIRNTVDVLKKEKQFINDIHKIL